MLFAAVTHSDEFEGYNPAQFLTYLRAYSTAQNEIIKQAKKEIYTLGF
jgi:hypothetical protein